MIKSDIVAQVEKFIVPSETIAVAVSGGIDSMVLLHAFGQAAKRRPFDFFVINIEHGIRGSASLADTDFVRRYCAEHKIDAFFEQVDALAYAEENGGTIEECARVLRYAVFDKYLKNGKCAKVALAHHFSDQSETVFMRIIRGTGLSGLAGMRSENGGYIRPLLDVTKDEIRNYQTENDVPYVVDETNFDNNYTRNLIRNKIFPSMGALSKKAEAGFVRLSKLAAETEDFLSSVTPDVEVDGDSAALNIIENEPTLIFKRRVKKCVEAVGVRRDFEMNHYAAVVGLLSSPNGSELNLPFGVSAHKEYGKIVFTKTKTQKNCFNVPFRTGKISVYDKALKIEPYRGEKPADGELLIDVSKIPPTAVLRNRRIGDRFAKFGGGTKSLGDYLTDKKVPKRLRDGLIVCADGNDVLFIAGIEISRSVRVDFSNEKNEDNIYKITLEA